MRYMIQEITDLSSILLIRQASESRSGAKGCCHEATTHLWLCCARWSQPGSRAGTHPGSWAGNWECWSWRSCRCWSSAAGSPRWALSSAGPGCCGSTNQRSALRRCCRHLQGFRAFPPLVRQLEGERTPLLQEKTELRSSLLQLLSPKTHWNPWELNQALNIFMEVDHNCDKKTRLEKLSTLIWPNFTKI